MMPHAAHNQRVSAQTHMAVFSCWSVDRQSCSVLGRRRGADVAFAGGGSSVLAVAGADDRGGCVMLLDTLAPPASAAIARINCSHVRGMSCSLSADSLDLSPAQDWNWTLHRWLLKARSA